MTVPVFFLLCAGNNIKTNHTEFTEVKWLPNTPLAMDTYPDQEGIKALDDCTFVLCAGNNTLGPAYNEFGYNEHPNTKSKYTGSRLQRVRL